LDKKRVYEKPLLRKVRLEVKTSVLAACNTSAVTTPSASVTANCKINLCYTSNLP
jgi:hypothetical protein